MKFYLFLKNLGKKEFKCLFKITKNRVTNKVTKVGLKRKKYY